MGQVTGHQRVMTQYFLEGVDDLDYPPSWQLRTRTRIHHQVPETMSDGGQEIEKVARVLSKVC